MLKEDIHYLCENLDIEKETICNINERIYPQDFSVYLSSRFESTPSNYQDVQDVLSPFQKGLNLEGNFNLNVFVCYYDINRDGITDLSIYFEGTLADNILSVIVFAEEVGF